MPTIIDFGNGSKTFFNGTDHPVNLITGAERMTGRKYMGGSIIASIPQDTLLNARLGSEIVSDLGSGISVCRQTVTSCDPLPKAAHDADYIIVSAIYAKAYATLYGRHPRMVTIRSLVVDKTGVPCGCLGFSFFD